MSGLTASREAGIPACSKACNQASIRRSTVSTSVPSRSKMTASGVFHWAPLSRQIRVAGPVRAMDDPESAAYWTTRPRASRLSAWASEQGMEVASRSILEARVSELDERYPGEAIPLPPFWGGYRLIQAIFVFWEGRPDRLHDLVEYLSDGSGGWVARRLAPC